MPYREARQDLDGYHAEACGCWIWTGYTDARGTPIRRTATSNTTAARHAWEKANGPVPEGKILHKDCGTKLCVRPTHLRPVTVSEHRYLTNRSRLSPEMAKRAYKASRKGMSQRKIAEIFSISPRTAGRIADGTYWALRDRK